MKFGAVYGFVLGFVLGFAFEAFNTDRYDRINAHTEESCGGSLDLVLPGALETLWSARQDKASWRRVVSALEKTKWAVVVESR